MIHIIIMASGFSRRMGKNKLLSNLRGKAVIKWVIEAARKTTADDITVICRDDEVSGIARECGVSMLHNPLAHMGQSAGIRLAVETLPQAEAWLFLAGDQPLISQETLESMIDVYRHENPDIVSAAWHGKGTLPALFSGSMAKHLLQLDGDKGGRTLIESGLFTVKYLELREEQEQWDIDTASQLNDIEKWLDARVEAGIGYDEKKL